MHWNFLLDKHTWSVAPVSSIKVLNYEVNALLVVIWFKLWGCNVLEFCKSDSKALHFSEVNEHFSDVEFEGEKNTRRRGWIVFAFSSFSPTEVIGQK